MRVIAKDHASGQGIDEEHIDAEGSRDDREVDLPFSVLGNYESEQWKQEVERNDHDHEPQMIGSLSCEGQSHNIPQLLPSTFGGDPAKESDPYVVKDGPGEIRQDDLIESFSQERYVIQWAVIIIEQHNSGDEYEQRNSKPDQSERSRTCRQYPRVEARLIEDSRNRMLQYNCQEGDAS